eukprot:CAMPEP_0174879856 /NCGR_PEP_ID=MMETSP1114-20130205/83469_1 /TAXON_ID=312471 /ORGANISM="Neobodo designis, Strain CCAP 1951/1" /LENGTH=586 /DNA_ID=CAMNT_0016115251 /DNA_START=150 /DNA_END=1910 /DNA_ORIENTATION=+
MASAMRVAAALAVAVALLGACALAHDDQRYNHQEHVPVFVDSLVPENNPSESYRYYTLRYCKPHELKYKSQTLGEVLGGSRKVYSKYDIPFGVDVPHEVICTEKLEAKDIADFREAIARKMHFTMYYDEIPLRGYVGEIDRDGDYWLYTTHVFALQWNLDRVIDAKIHPDTSSKVKLPAHVEDGKTLDVTFAYSAKWTSTDVAFEDREANNAGELYDTEVEIQWFSIVNSIVLTVLISGFLIFIVLKVLRKDYQRYSKISEEDDQEETGWKRLHADVFRFPKHRALFCAILGCGVQIMLIFVCMLTLAVVGVFYPYGRGTAYAAVIVIYSLTAVVAGYVSGGMYRKLNGTVWVHNVLVTVTLFVGPAFAVWAFLNTVAIVYGSTAALPFGTIVALFALYFLVTFPLTLAGAIVGKNYAGDLDAPTRTKFAPREIPPPPVYGRQSVQVAIAGFLPFSAIFVELYYVFISIWGHHNFMPFGILYLVFVILCIITACISVSLTYLQLSTEDHEWWWRSVLTGGATAFYVAAYCLYFLSAESQMTGFLQLSFYFGYMGLLCYALFLMGGAIGFLASLTFVREIYRTIKSD